jgi:uncharacterized protein (DUF362 family)
MEKAIIYVQETRDRKAFVQKVWDIWAEKISVLQPKKILIKPNIVSHESYPTTTHPDTLGAILEILSRSASYELIVGDAAAVDLPDPSQVIHNHPLNNVCQRYSVPLLDLYQTKQVYRESPRGYSLELSALPLESELVISLPVLKVHFICQMTGALKNQYGYLGKGERLMMHYDPNFPEEIRAGFQHMANQAGIKGAIIKKDLDQGIAEVNALAMPQLFIVDAIETLVEANEQRHGGTIQSLGQMFAGTDPVALDCYGLTLLQKIEPKLADKRPSDIRYLKLAMEYGLGIPDYQLVWV